MNIDFSNPLVLIIGCIIFLTILYFWNKRNTRKQRERRERSFRNSYYNRKEKKHNTED